MILRYGFVSSHKVSCKQRIRNFLVPCRSRRGGVLFSRANYGIGLVSVKESELRPMFTVYRG